ncbi:hypothetical protein NDU88_000999 [Pleurodeles waltl]|uniref:Uncharacterized protein n=1 Tax=Pleurodeles waltl TaxID=8319 RepID=A0AAV7VYU4_PLEWA|nr:hypothetical protein NDU88_000999 [Pleurodeles waltl]
MRHAAPAHTPLKGISWRLRRASQAEPNVLQNVRLSRLALLRYAFHFSAYLRRARFPAGTRLHGNFSFSIGESVASQLIAERVCDGVRTSVPALGN